MNVWLVRLNGMPLMKVTAPYYASPTAIARKALMNEPEDDPRVVIEWLI